MRKLTLFTVVALAIAAQTQKVAKLTALDYIEIQQLNYKYAFALDTCSNKGED